MQEARPQLVGEAIRRLRRQQSLTQTELGEEHFSKSYVSAVERDKIVPSYEALRYFAERLDQPTNYFEKILLQNESERENAALVEAQRYEVGEKAVQEELLPLLDILLESSAQHNVPLFHEFPALDPEMVATLPPSVQGRYSFLIGLLAQQKGDFAESLHALEYALTLTPEKYQPAILDALGINYYRAQAYYVALEYHKRALHLLEKDMGNGHAEVGEQDGATPRTRDDLRLKVEFHCGNDYYAIGAHKQACAHYERARVYLRSAHDMHTVGQLYLKLGYSIYADVYQRTALSPTTKAAMDEIEREFQRAISFLVQSRTLYQVSSNRIGESRTRLLQAMVLLDFSTRQRQAAQQKAQTTGKFFPVRCASLLDEAAEQCQQVLMAWQPEAAPLSAESEGLLYSALSYLIRVFVQRAYIAQLSGYVDTAIRERDVASRLCQLTLDILATKEFPWSLVRDIERLQANTSASQYSISLPNLPENVLHKAISPEHAVNCSMVFFAAGTVAEILGRAATNSSYAHVCYDSADQCFQASLRALRLVIPERKHDMSYLIRNYQRCIDILEERRDVSTDTDERIDQVLLNILKDALYSFH